MSQSKVEKPHDRQGDHGYLVEIRVRRVLHLRIERIPSGVVVLAISALQALWAWLVAR